MRNVFALQQGVRAIIKGQQAQVFERARHYYSLFFTSPEVSLSCSEIKLAYELDRLRRRC